MTFTVSKCIYEYLIVVCCLTDVFDTQGIGVSKINIM